MSDDAPIPPPAAPDTPDTPAPPGISYGTAKQLHPKYLECAGAWREIATLYKGGYYVAERAGELIPPLTDEAAGRYSDRLKAAAYINYLGQIVDHFVSAVFSHTLDVSEASDANDPTTPGGQGDPTFWSMFSQNADRKGTAFCDVMKCVLRETLLKQRWYVGCDFPKVAPTTPAPTNALDEQKLGITRGYVYEIPVDQIINWENDDETGLFRWCVINRCETKQPTPFDLRKTVTETFKIWTRDPITGVVRWDLFTIDYQPDNPPKPEDAVMWADGGTVTFQQIPILILELSDAFWVGNKLGPLAKEHFQRRATLVASENNNILAIPVYQAGAEVPAVGGAISANSEDPERGDHFVARARSKGFVVTGGQDKIYFAEPSGAAYEIVDKQITNVKDEMFRVVHQMAASIDNNRMSLGRSGESKKQDRFAEAIVLGEFGRLTRSFAKRIYDTIAAMRGENVVWVVAGLDGYDVEDRDVLISEATQMSLVPIPSKTFQVEYKASVADKLLPTLNTQTKAVIRQEIQEGVENEQAMQQVADDARMDALQNPQSQPGADGDGDGQTGDDSGKAAA